MDNANNENKNNNQQPKKNYNNYHHNHYNKNNRSNNNAETAEQYNKKNNGNVKYNYKPQRQQNQHKDNCKPEQESAHKCPPPFSEGNKLLIPIVALLAVLILGIVLIQNIQMNKLMDQYGQLVSKYESVISQNAALNKTISDSLAKIAEKQTTIYVTGDQTSSETITNPGTNVDPDPTPTEQYPVGFDDTAFLGISVDEETMGYSPFGVKIANIFQYSAAALCGLQPNDVIISIDGQATPTMTELGNIISAHKAGDEVFIEYARSVNGDIEFKTVAIELSARGNFAVNGEE